MNQANTIELLSTELEIKCFRLSVAWVSCMVFATVFCSNLCLAAEVQPGVIYKGGASVELSNVGVSMVIPKGWRGGLPQGSEFFVLEPRAQKGTILVYIDQLSEQELRRTMSNSIELDGYSLVPRAAPKKLAKYWSGDYTVAPAANGLSSSHIAARRVGQTVVAFIALDVQGDTHAALQAKSLATRVVIRKVAIRQPQPGAVAAANSWAEYMRGRYIAHLVTRSGYTEKTQIWLCSDGSFAYSDGGGGYGGGASGAYRDSSGGTWSAQGALPGQGQLVLKTSPGQTYTFDLTLENRKLYLDGNQWLRDTNQRCQ